MKLFASFALAAALWPQQQPTAPTFLETLEVRITNVDVVVTDRRGKAVRGLRRDDFAVLENGVPQTITNFAEYGAAEIAPHPASGHPLPAARGEGAEDVQQRKFLFYIDEMSLTNSTRAKLLESATALVRKEMRPGDEAMVVTRAKSPDTVLEFTGDRELVEARLRLAIDQAAFGARTASQAEELFHSSIHSSSAREYASMARVYATRVERRVTSTLRTLLGLVGSLNQISGRKVMVVISESLSSEPGREAFTLEAVQSNGQPTVQEMAGMVDASGELPLSTKFDPGVIAAHASWFDARPMIRELAARASANGVTIYSLQPDVAKATSIPGGQITTPGRTTRSSQQTLRSATASIDQFHRQIVEGTRNTLQTLADDTGGKFFLGASQISDGFRQIAEDLTAYYSIGYRTEGGGENGIRKIDVRVKNHPELVVRARREMLRRTPEREMDEIVAANLIVPRNVNELGITAAAGRPEHHIDSYRVPVIVRVPLSKLTFIPDGARYRASFTLHFAAADGAGYTAGVYREQTVEIPAAEIDVMRKRIFAHTAILIVAPGTLKVAIGVYDRFSHLTGFQQVEVIAK